MRSDKNQEKKNLEDNISDQQDDLLDGKTLHDLYRHTAKLIK
jgi:hypothetical protein